MKAYRHVYLDFPDFTQESCYEITSKVTFQDGVKDEIKTTIVCDDPYDAMKMVKEFLLSKKDWFVTEVHGQRFESGALLVTKPEKKRQSMKNNMPEIGKTYAFFDDGKTGLTRCYKALVLDIIPYNVVEELYPKLFAGWKENLEKANFLYAPITDFFIKCSIPNYAYNNVYFVRDKNDGWFSIDYPHSWMSGLLDVDGEYGRKNDVPPVDEWVAGKDYLGG